MQISIVKLGGTNTNLPELLLKFLPLIYHRSHSPPWISHPFHSELFDMANTFFTA